MVKGPHVHIPRQGGYNQGVCSSRGKAQGVPWISQGHTRPYRAGWTRRSGRETL